jgi:tetratricopeptide (TPR) repeat protein
MYSTWNISFASIRRQSESAAMLLRLWAFFGNEDLWYELLRRGGTEDGPKWLQDLTESRLSFDQGMRVLCSHGLVDAHSITAQNGSESNGYSVHACVHSWMIHVLTGPNEQVLAKLAMECTSLHVPKREFPEYWLIRRRLLLHADRCRQLLGEADNDGSNSWFPARLGILYADQGRYKEAEVMYKRALEGNEKSWGPEHTSMLDIFNNLGRLYQNQGQYKEAEVIYKRAIEGYEKVVGPEHTSTLKIVNNLGIVYANQRRYKEAEAMFERALEGDEKAWGPEYTLVLDIVNNLGNLYAEQRRYKEAETMYERALEGQEKARGPEYTSTLQIVNNLGILYKNQGRYKEAEAMYEQALEGYEKALGKDAVVTHIPFLNAVTNLGLLNDDIGQAARAEQLYREALRGVRKVFGDGSDRHKELEHLLACLSK